MGSLPIGGFYRAMKMAANEKICIVELNLTISVVLLLERWDFRILGGAAAAPWGVGFRFS